jgi:hypothetical protein
VTELVERTQTAIAKNGPPSNVVPLTRPFSP